MTHLPPNISPRHYGDLCMKGTIYSSQKCPVCGGAFKFDENRRGLFCQDHPDQRATKGFFVRFGREHTKRFANDFEAALRHLTGLRFKTDEGTFDIRDYQKTTPLAFSTLVQNYLNYKERSNVSLKTMQHIKHVLSLAENDWGNTNIKELGEGEIEDFLFKDFGISDKTRHNYKSVLSAFWTWVVRREKRKSRLEMPVFPDIGYELGWRNITDVETQQAIVEEVKLISYDLNPRIWLGVMLLTVYSKIRPGELIDIQEGHINTSENWIVIPHPKERKPKFIHLLPEHSELIDEIWEPKGMPQMYFFRHLVDSVTRIL